jgi:DNA replication protein DnaC
MNDALRSVLRKLRLSGLSESLEVRLQEAAGHSLSHMEFLELILQDELAVRSDRQLQRRVKAALFRELKPLDQFDWAFNPSIKKKLVLDLATCRFVRERRDVLWLGPPGVGKSFLVQAIGYQAIKAGHQVLYRSVFDVVRDFLHDEALSAEDKVLSRYLKPDLLIIDDMGMKQLPKRSGEYLFEIIMRRYETRSTMMTSNRPLEDWGKLLGDVPTATAILDRFLHHAEVVQMNGRSYRLRSQAGASSDEAGDSKPAKAPTGSEVSPSSSKPAKAPIGSVESPSSSKPAKAPIGSVESPSSSKPAKAPIGSVESPSSSKPAKAPIGSELTAESTI